jgi:amino acid transporter
MASNATPLSAEGQPTLAKGAIGLAGQLFQSITHMAPGAGVIFSAGFMASRGGGSLALAWAFATVACMLTAICLVDVVRKVRSAGGYFVIHSVALGHFVGFSTSWLWFLFEPLVPAGLSMFFGKVLSDFLLSQVGIYIPWFVFAPIMVALLAYTTYVGIKQSSQLTVILGVAEIVILLLFAVIWIVQAGANQPVISFSPASSPHGLSGVFFATIFGVLSFLGFEAGVPLAEESTNAKRSLVISILVSTLGVGLFYVVLGYGTVAGYGFTNAQDFADKFSADNFNAYFTMASGALGVFGVLLMLVVIANSSFACSVAAENAVTRVFYSLGRAGVFPRWLSRINPNTQTPANAVFFEAGIALVFALALGFIFGPIDAYGLLGLLWTVALMVVYTMTNLSSFSLYYFKYRDEFNVFRHLIIPIIASIVMFFPLAASLFPQVVFGILFGDYTPNAYPFNLGLPIVVVWFLIGLAVYLYLKATRPNELNHMANEMAIVELVGEDNDPRHRATLNAEMIAPGLYQDRTE